MKLYLKPSVIHAWRRRLVRATRRVLQPLRTLTFPLNLRFRRSLCRILSYFVIPAKAGIQILKSWIPARLASKRARLASKRARRFGGRNSVRNDKVISSRVLKKDLLRTSLRYVIILVVAVGIGVVVYRTGIKQVQAIWAPTLAVWKHRQQLNVVNSASATLHSNTTIAVTVDTKSLVSLGKMKSDCSDLRIMYQPNDSTNTELSRYIVYPGGGTCASSTTTKVFFPLQSDLTTSDVTKYYYIYFGNPQATAPSNSDNAFDIGAKDALLVCPFDGSTTCAAGEVPSAESGTVRYSQNASALSFDGVNDEITLNSDSSLTTTFTFEAWIKYDGIHTNYPDLYKSGTQANFWKIHLGTASKLGFTESSIVDQYSNITLTPNVWTHVAVVKNGDSENNVTFYVNGSQAGTISVGTVNTPDGGAQIGGFGNERFGGLIDEVRISNIARYTSNFTPSTTPFTRDQYTRLLYHMDENGGMPDGTPLRAYDDSGNGNHGTVTGAKYVDGLVGVDNSSQISAISSQSYAGREGKFLEEGTTNKITNPSFENGTYDTNWTASTGTLELQDEFYTARAAGVVNGTAAEAGPGNRSVTDTENKLSITGGQLSFSGGKTSPAWSDPRIWYPATTRVAGKVLVGKRNLSSTSGLTQSGFSRGSSSGYDAGTIYFSSGGDIYYYENTLAKIGTYTSSTDYQTAVVLRGTGAYHFIKGGAFTNWTLLYPSEGFVVTPLYPFIETYSGASTTDYLRIPTSTWLPTPLAYSTFSTPGATSTETTGPDGQTTSALALTGGTVAGNVLAITPSLGGEVITNPTFDSDTSGWTPADSTISSVVGGQSNNAMEVTATSAWGRARQTVAITSNSWYLATPYHKNGSTSGQIYFGSYIAGSDYYSRIFSNSSWTLIPASFRSQGTSLYISAVLGSGVVGATTLFDEFSVKPLTLSSLFSTVPTSDSNVIADAVVSANTAGTQAGLVLNLDDTTNPQNLIIVYMDGSNIKVEEMVGGVWNATAKQTTAMSGALAYSSTGVLRAVRDGTKLRVYYNNTLVGAELTMMANTNTKHGVFSTYSGNTFDNFSLFARGTDGEYSIPGEMDGQVTVTAETSSPYVKFGSSSMKAVALYDGTVTTSLNPGNTNTHTLSAYVYNGTAGAIGGTVDATVAKVVFGGLVSTPTYTDVGGGWWRLSYSAVASNATAAFGLEVLAGKTVYVDGVQLEEKSYPTTYADGSLQTTQSGGYAWTGSAHNSTSTRTVNALRYNTAGNLSATAGTISMWVKPDPFWAKGSTSQDTYFFRHISGSANRIYIYQHWSSSGLQNNMVVSVGGSSNGANLALDKWSNIVVTWSAGTAQWWVNNVSMGTMSATDLATLGTEFDLGYNVRNHSLSDLRIYGSSVTSDEVSDLYYAGLASKQDTFATVTVDNFSDFSKDGTATNKITNPSFENSTFNTNWFATQTYSLQDEFTDTKAAGSINGTNATDAYGNSTGSTRTVIDTTNKLSIIGGQLSFATGGVSFVDPGLWYSSTRATGQVLLTKVNFSQSTEGLYFGFSNTLSGFTAPTYTSFRMWGGNIANAGGAIVGSYTTGVDYYLSVVLRATGTYYYIKGGAFTNWTLLWASSVSNGSDRYPFIYKDSVGNATAFTADNIRIPSSLWLPTPIVSDGFSTSITDGLGHAEGIAGGLGAGGNGLTRTGGTVAGGKLVITPATGDELIDGWTNNVSVPYETFTSSGPTITSAINTSAYGDAYKNIGAVTAGQWYSFSTTLTLNSGINPKLLFSHDTGGNSSDAYPFQGGGLGKDIVNGANNINFRLTNTRAAEYLGLYTIGGNNNFFTNAVSLKPLTLSSLFSTVNAGTANVIADVTIPAYTLGTQAGLAIGLDDATNPTNFLIAYLDGNGKAVVEQRLASTGLYSTVVTAATATWNTTYVLRVVKDGTAVRLYYNNVFIGSGTCDASITGTLYGMFSTYSGNTFDNFTIFPRGTDGEYATLPAEPSEVLLATENTTTTYNKTGGKSVKLENTSTLNPFQYVTAINAGNTNEHTLSAYVYASAGSAVTSSDAKLVFNGSVVTPTLYSDVGGGWWRLSYSAPTSVGTANFGIEVLAGKTLYVDGVQLEESSSVTSYIDGSLGRGYDWTSTANDSTSTRTGGDGKGESPTSVWHMDDPSTGSGLVGDASPNLNHLTLTGASWMDTAGNGGTKTRYISFDGVNDYLYRSFDADYDFGTSDFTLAGLFRHPLTVTGTDTIISRYGSAGWKVYVNSSGFLCFGIDDDSTWGPDDSACSTVSYVDNKWHSFSAVKGSTSLTLYVDGEEVAVDPTLSSTGSLSTASSLYVGIDSDGTSNPWTGYLDEFAIYPYARTATQIKTDNLGQQLSLLIGSYENDNLTDGLIAWWKMDETSGTSVIDSSGNGITGTATTPAITTGKYANARDFVPANTDYITFGTNSKMNETNGFTFASWIYTDAYTHNYPTLYVKNGYGATEGFIWIYQQITAPGNIYYAYATGTTAPALTLACGLTAGKWEHLVLSHNRANKSVSCYVNGVLKDRKTYTGTMLPVTAGQAHLGKYPASSTHDGRLDEVRLYSRPLDSNEAAQLFNWSPPPIAHWNFDEGSGASLYDISGNGVTGTWYGNENHYSQGRFGKAGDFDASTNYLTVSLPAFTGGGFTSSLWIYPKLGGSGIKRYFTKDGGHEIETNGGIPKCYFVSDGYKNATSDAALPVNQWSYVSCVLDSTGIKIYVNGIQKGFSAYSNLTTTFSGIAYIGQHQGGAYRVNAKIDDFKMYNYARSQQQIISDMLSGGPVVSPVSSSVSSGAGRANGAVAWYKFDEGQGTVANNSGFGGSALNGTLTSMSAPATATSGWTNAGKFGKAVNFDGSDDYVNLGNSTIFDLINGLTLSVWVKFNALPAVSYLVTKGPNDQTNGQYGLFMAGNKLTFVIRQNGGNAVSSDTTVTTGVWYHVVGAWDGSKMRLYINGKEEGTPKSLAAPMASNTDNMQIGRLGLPGYLYQTNGSIDEVKIYNFALSPDQIKLEFNQSSALKLGSGNESNGVVLASDTFSSAGSISTETPVLPWTGGVKANGKMSVTPTLGSTMWDADASTFEGSSVYGWIYGTATNVSNTLVTSYVSAYLNTGSDLNSNLTVGTWYQYAVDRKINSGSATQSLYSNPTWEPSITVTETTFTRKYQIFRAKHASDNQLTYNGGAQVITIDNLSLQPLTLSSLFSTVPTSDKDIVVSTDIISTDGTQAGIVANLNSASVPTAGVVAYLTRTNATTGAKVTLDKFTTATTWTNLIPAATVTYVAGAPLKVSTYHSDPNTLKVNVFYNNVQVGAEQTVTDVSIINNTIHGLFSTYSGNTFDNFTLTTQPKNYSYSVPGSTELDLPPVAEWNMDEGTGQYANDTSGNNNTGTLGTGSTADSADPTWATGKFGKALSFDGSNDYVGTSANIFSNSIFGSGITMSAWVKPTNTTQHSLIFSIEGAYYLGLDGVNHKFAFEVAGNGLSGNSTSVPTTNWTYIVGVYDGINAKIYVNGILENTYAQSRYNIDTLNRITAIGQQSAGQYYFNGLIDQVKIYNYARTPAQVAYDYNRGKPIAHWRFDEVSGVTANNASGGGYNGTHTNGPTITSSGKLSSAVTYDGGDDFTDVGTGPTVVNTVSFWVKPTTTTEYFVDLNGSAYIVSSAGAVSATGFTTPTYYINGVATASPVLAAGVWTHVVVVTTTSLSATDLDIGRIEGVGNMEGTLDDVKLFTYPLTATQVKTEYTGGTVRYGN